MQFESAKCPNCGAEIKVPDGSTRARCMFCGSHLNVQEAIQNYRIEISGKVSVSGLSSPENDINRARQCMGAKDFEKAYEYYCRAIDKQSDNFEAWNGCLYAVTRSLKFYEPDIVPITGYMGLMSIAYNCVKYASENHLPNIKNNLERVAMIFTEYAKRVVRPEYKDYENRQTTSGKGSRKWGIILIVIAIFIAPFFWPFALLSLVLGIVLIFSANKTINQIKTIESFISDENKQYINYFLNLIKDC